MRVPDQPGFDLIAQGPVNRPKDGISPLSEIIETDWAPYTFTMNWAFTRKGVPVHFKAGEPYCHIIPVRRGEIETFEPELRPISEQPELHQQQSLDREPHPLQCRNRNGPERAGTEALFPRPRRGGPAQREVQDHRTRVKLRPFEGE